MLARKLSYVAHDGDSGGQFVALLELIDMEGGVEKSRSFVLYKYFAYCELCKAEMIEVSSREEAEKLFPFAFEKTWQETTNWLYKVAVGGDYTTSCGDDLVDVGDRPIREEKKANRLKFGDLQDIYHVRMVEKNNIEEEIQKERDHWLPGFYNDDDDELDESDPKVANFFLAKADLEEELRVREDIVNAILREIMYLEQKGA